MLSGVWCWSLLYWLMALVIIFPPDEAVSAGITVEGFLAPWINSEMNGFIHYHIKRTSATMVAHSLLLPGYFAILKYNDPWISQRIAEQVHIWFFEFLLLCSVVPFVVALTFVWTWRKNDWREHPIAKSLALYASPEINTPNKWVSVASDINNEFRRIDKFSNRVSSVACVVATDSWLIRITSYRAHILPLRDAILLLEGSSEASISHHSGNVGQFLQIRVSSIRPQVKQFSFKIDSSVWNELDRKLINPVVNTRQIVIHQSLADKFMYSFDEAVSANPTVTVDQDRDLCIGCMINVPNVKIIRRCEGAERSPNVPDNNIGTCVSCSCRPMWCLSCLAKWFAARQDEHHPETWLSSRAPCPTCRSPFCILDVCLIRAS